MKDWHDYHPSFLEAGRAKAIFDWLNKQPMKPETGECTKPPTHDTIQWGPRQSVYLLRPQRISRRIQRTNPESTLETTLGD